MTLPKNWVEATIGEFIGGTQTLDPRNYPDEQFDLYSVPSYTDYAPETPEGREIGSSKQIVQKGDVLLCKIVPHIRRGWVVPESRGKRQIASGEWIVFRNHGLEPEYIRRFVLSDIFHDQFMQTVAGVGGSLMRARPSEAAELPIALPPLAEQRRIIAKLDTLIAHLSRARTELDRVAALAVRQRTAVLATVFDRPRGERAELGDITLPSAPIRYGVLQPGHEKNIGVPLIRVCDLKGMAVAWSNLRRIAPAIDQQFANARVANGDVLLSVVGTIGRVAVITGMTEPTNIARAVARLRPDPAKVNPRWLGFRLASPQCQEGFAADAREVARKTLNVSFIKSMAISLPSVSDQLKAVSEIETAFARADRLEADAASARAMLDRLEAVILARAFRGELVLQDIADEPASVLLDRIRAARAAAPKATRGRRKSTSNARQESIDA